MITPFPDPASDAVASRSQGLEHVASWAAAVLSRVSGEEPDVLPGIVSPLDLRADFAVNSQSDAASVTLGNGVVRLSGVVATSGALTLSLRWSFGYRANGIGRGDVLGGEWVVERVEAMRLDLRHAALEGLVREVELPVVTIVKTSAGVPGDELIVQLSGEAPECRDASIRGWSRA